MPSIATSDLARMDNALLFDGEDRARQLSRFWTLLALSAVIATAGIIIDSTATVIGAMIVAPLMTPILGTVLSVVTVDGRNLVRSLLLVVGGATLVVLIAWGMSTLVQVPVEAQNNLQVASRVNPRLMDLVAALATGAVGSFALVRSDVSDTLPGVAIAISLVPPLCVVGATLEAGKPHQASGALLLFLTNVAAILLSGLVVMALYRVGLVAAAGGRRSSLGSRVTRLAIVVGVLLLVVPLGAESERITALEIHQGDVTAVATTWAKARNWEIVGVEPAGNVVRVRAVGPLPIPDPRTFRVALDAAGLKAIGVRLELSPIRRADLPGS
jgi:uncharacterized hydrophobic protein (TIGR00271 family)